MTSTPGGAGGGGGAALSQPAIRTSAKQATTMETLRIELDSGASFDPLPIAADSTLKGLFEVDINEHLIRVEQRERHFSPAIF
jgi:hypothetical protein